MESKSVFDNSGHFKNALRKKVKRKHSHQLKPSYSFSFSENEILNQPTSSFLVSPREAICMIRHYPRSYPSLKGRRLALKSFLPFLATSLLSEPFTLHNPLQSLST